MNLPRRAVRPRIPATPLANVALLVFGVIAITGLYAVARGPGFRFATFAEAGGFSKASPPVRVHLLSGGIVSVDGDEVAEADLAPAVARRLAGAASPSVLLIVSPDVTYRRMLAAYGSIAALESAPRISLPPRAWVEAADSRGAAGGGTMKDR